MGNRGGDPLVADVKAKKPTLAQRVTRLEAANRKLRAECKLAAAVTDGAADITDLKRRVQAIEIGQWRGYAITVQTDPHSHQIASEAKAIALTAAKHAKTLSTHVERLLREKETLVRISRTAGHLPPELQR